MGLKARPSGKSSTRPSTLGDDLEALKAFAFGFPEAYEDHPWGESVAKVRRKVFVFFGRSRPHDLHLSVKLPESGAELLAMPFATPTGYGLGKSGWVTIQCTPETRLPLELLRNFVSESYRAVAPKTLSARLEASVE